ncbi:MAG TPA: hypothetical protein VFO61_05330 [Alphaproteobacteria bacterium]|nr:hypothetical protein [Alphaproteobacteria bacterium]
MRLLVARTIGDVIRTLREAGAPAIARICRVPPATALVFLVAALWLAVGCWIDYARPQQFDLKAYQRYQEQVANCRTLDTSEARYDCVAQTLIGRDRMNFGTAMIVFLPPLLLILGHYVWLEVQAGMREREHARHAEEMARQQLSRYRREMQAERAAALARAHAHPESVASHPAVPPSHAGPHGVEHSGDAPEAHAPRRA